MSMVNYFCCTLELSTTRLILWWMDHRCWGLRWEHSWHQCWLSWQLSIMHGLAWVRQSFHQKRCGRRFMILCWLIFFKSHCRMLTYLVS